MEIDGVNTAFEIILEEINRVIIALNQEGSLAFQRAEYEKANYLSRVGKNLKDFLDKVQELRNLWINNFDTETRLRVKIGDISAGVYTPERRTRREQSLEKRRKASFTIRSHTKGPRTNLKVTFPDGTIMYDPIAARTFTNVLEKIGIEKVRELSLTVNNFPLVSKEKHPEYNQYRIGRYYIMTKTSTKYKKSILEKIGRKLNIPIKVEIIK